MNRYVIIVAVVISILCISGFTIVLSDDSDAADGDHYVEYAYDGDDVSFSFDGEIIEITGDYPNTLKLNEKRTELSGTLSDNARIDPYSFGVKFDDDGVDITENYDLFVSKELTLRDDRGSFDINGYGYEEKPWTIDFYSGEDMSVTFPTTFFGTITGVSGLPDGLSFTNNSISGHTDNTGDHTVVITTSNGTFYMDITVVGSLEGYVLYVILAIVVIVFIASIFMWGKGIGRASAQ